MRANEDPFDLVLSGTMRRHRETADGMGYPPALFDERLNEMEYFALARDMQVHHDIDPPVTSEDFVTHMPQTLAAWEQATINGVEPFATFEARIKGALAEAAKPGKRVLCMTSGGVISMVMRAALGLIHIRWRISCCLSSTHLCINSASGQKAHFCLPSTPFRTSMYPSYAIIEHISNGN